MLVFRGDFLGYRLLAIGHRVRSTRRYSARKATIGSIFAARRAGR